MKSKLEKNYIYNLIYQIVIMILPLVTTPYLSRTLGAEAIGMYTYVFSIVTYFNLFGSLGMSMYVQREIAYLQDDKEKRSKVFWEIYTLRAITITISMISFYLLFANNVEFSKYYKILLLDMFITIFDTSAFFYGIEEMKTIVKAHFSIRIFIIVCMFLFVKQPSDLTKFLVINVLANFCGNLTLLINLHKYICKISVKGLNLLKHLKPTIILFIPQIATQVYTVLDKIMLGAMVSNKSELGFYEQAEKTVKIFLNIITALGIVMAPRIANKYSKGEYEGIKKDITNSLNFVYFLSIPMAFGIVAIAKDFVLLFLGSEFYKSICIIYIIAPILFIIGIANVIGMQYLFPTKKQLQYNISVIIGAIINVILNFMLIPKLFSIGAAIGTILAELIVLLIQIYFVRKDFNLKSIFIMSLKYFASAIIMFVFVALLNKYILLNLSIILRMMIDAAIGIIIYLLILIIFKDSFTKKIIQRFIQFKDSKRYKNEQ